MDAVYRTGINGFLNDILAVTVLADHPRAPIVWLNIESIAGNMGAVLAANAGNLIYIDSPLPYYAPQFWFKASALSFSQRSS
jgi:hypothetical protein